jgi:hypothetical protein
MAKALIAREIVRAYMRLLTSATSRNMYNVCSPVGRPLLDVIEIIENQCGAKLGIKENLRFAPRDKVFRLVGRDEWMVRKFGRAQPLLPLNETLRCTLASEA